MQNSSRLDTQLIGYGLLVLLCAFSSALNITECNGRTGIINNTMPNCSYTYLNCSGVDSMFCSSNTTCSTNFVCYENNTDPSPDPATPTPEPATSVTLSPSDVRRQCRPGVTKRFSYPQNCNYFYYCIDGFLLVEQCPIGYGFNNETGACGGRIQNLVDCTLK